MRPQGPEIDDATEPNPPPPVDDSVRESRALVFRALLRGTLDVQTAARRLWMLPEVLEDLVTTMREAIADEAAARDALTREVVHLRERVRTLVARLVEAPPPSSSTFD
jgi:hypothetical protein